MTSCRRPPPLLTGQQPRYPDNRAECDSADLACVIGSPDLVAEFNILLNEAPVYQAEFLSDNRCVTVPPNHSRLQHVIAVLHCPHGCRDECRIRCRPLPDESTFRATAEQLANVDLTGGLNSQEGDLILATSYEVGTGDGGSSTVSVLPSYTVRVNSNGSFSPQNLTVDVGSTVYWEVHTYETVVIRDDNGAFDSGRISLLEVSPPYPLAADTVAARALGLLN